MTKDSDFPNQNCRDLYESLLQYGIPRSERGFQLPLDATFAGEFLLPKGFADGSTTIIATAGLPQCVLLLNSEHWEAIRAKLIGMAVQSNLPFPLAMQAFRSLLLGNAVELEIGPSGAVELPIHLFEHAQITGKVRSVWHGSAIELVCAEAPHPR